MQSKDRPFPRYARDYFVQLLQQYELLLDETHQQAPPSIVHLIAHVTAKSDPKDATWADVFVLETAYLYAVAADPDRLRAEVVYTRTKYRNIVGAAAYASYAQTVPSDVSKSTDAQLRAELQTLAERIRYLYTFVPPKESVRNRLAIHAALWTLGTALIAIAIYAIGIFAFNQTAVTILVVTFVGQMGGFLSVQQRLQNSSGADPLFKELLLTNGWFSVVVIAPISGGIFAIVLYLVFVGGLMSGGLFPHFGPTIPVGSTPVPPSHARTERLARAPGSPTPAPCPATAACPSINVTQFFILAEPTAIEDWGKLLVWAFVAGFAERFVPDVLTRLTGDTTRGSGGGLVTAEGGSGVPGGNRPPAGADARAARRGPEDGDDDDLGAPPGSGPPGGTGGTPAAAAPAAPPVDAAPGATEPPVTTP